MQINDIKKLLYINKPIASVCHSTGYHKYYETELDNNLFIFRIPLNEAEGFKEEEPSQLLIRWLYEFKEL